METSPTIGEITKALCSVQGQIKGAIKDSDNPYFKSKYADLSSVWDACRSLLQANGLAVFQTIGGDGTGVVVTTMLSHSSGEWVRDSARTEPKDMTPQSVGSATTYLRRYGLAAIVGVVQVDDDAESAQPERSATKKVKNEAVHQPPGGGNRGGMAKPREPQASHVEAGEMGSVPMGDREVQGDGTSSIPLDPPDPQAPPDYKAQLQGEWWLAWAGWGEGAQQEHNYEEVAKVNGDAVVAHLRKIKTLLGPPPGRNGKWWTVRDFLLLQAVNKFNPGALRGK